ncbi:LysR family transcriptional regulator [Phytohabitans flavus]|uniref:helix-turn-helix domain-containing protein n=1 Tax=Phytohabitans flavus TaxID=1076124 RepID=UPI0036364B1A
MAKHLELVLLRSFVTAVRSGSISRAATALGHTQPALSQQLRKLEGVVGRPLLYRSPAGVLPTRAGEELCRTPNASSRSPRRHSAKPGVR